MGIFNLSAGREGREGATLWKLKLANDYSQVSLDKIIAFGNEWTRSSYQDAGVSYWGWFPSKKGERFSKNKNSKFLVWYVWEHAEHTYCCGVFGDGCVYDFCFDNE